MKKEYSNLKQFFEQHKTKHTYKAFVRSRSSERLRQLDEICSNHPFKTRFEEYLKLSNKEPFSHKIVKAIQSILNYLDELPEDVIGCLSLIVLVGLFVYCCYDIKNLLICISVISILFILIFPFYQIDNIFRSRKRKIMAKSFPFFNYAYQSGHHHGTDSMNGISKDFAEECDLCLQKFFDDFKLFFCENQKDISKVIHFKKKYRNEIKEHQIRVKIDAIYSCFYYPNFTRFFDYKEHLKSACAFIQDSGKIVSEELYQIDFNKYENSIKNRFNEIEYNPKKALIYTTWICLNIICFGSSGYVLKIQHDLKDRAIAPLYQKSYAQYEKDLNIWENGVLVKINTSMTDYYRLGEDLSYGYKINGINVSNNSIIEMPEDNIFDFIVSVTEYDDTFDDHGYSEESITLSREDLIKGYRVVLETYVHENGKYSNQGYASFKTKFILSLPDDDNKPKEPHKSDFYDDVRVTFFDALKSAIGLE